MSRVAWLNDLRRGRRALDAAPVYEALFADGSFTRKSFWSDRRAPVNAAEGRPAPWRYRLHDVVHPVRSLAPRPEPVWLIAGWVEYKGGRWRDGEAGNAEAVNDGSPLAPIDGVPEAPSQEAIAALDRRRNRTVWLALLKRVRAADGKRSKSRGSRSRKREVA